MKMKKSHWAFFIAVCIVCSTFAGSLTVMAEEAKGTDNTGTKQEEKPGPFKVEFVSSQPGNIFFDDDPILLTFSLKTTGASAVKVKAAYDVLNGDNKIILSKDLGDIDVTVGTLVKKTVTIPKVKRDVYTLRFKTSLPDVKLNKTLDIPFSSVASVKQREEDSPFGVCAHMAFGTRAKDTGPTVIPLMKNTGIQWHRDEYRWGGVEKVKGQYTFDNDSWVDLDVKNGIKPLIILDYGNPLYGGTPYTDEQRKAYGKYAEAMAAHFKGRVEHFEVWNEWNGGFGTVDKSGVTYALLLKEAYLGVKRGNPEATVVGCAAAGVDLGWIETIFKTIGTGYMDAVSCHPYFFPSSPEGGAFEANMKSVHELIKKYNDGKDMPVWATETGYPTQYGDLADEGIAAAYLARTLMVARAVNPKDKVTFYDFQNDDVGNGSTEYNYGWIKHFAKEVVPYAAKKSYIAHAAVVKQLTGATFAGESVLNNNVKIYKFKKKDHDFIAVWSLEKNENIGLKLNQPKVKVTDYFGNEQEISAVDGVLTLAASKQPVYIEGSYDNIEAAAPALAPDQDVIDVVAGEEFKINVKKSSVIAGMDGSYDVYAPDGFTMLSSPDFKAGEENGELQFKAPEDAKAGNYNIAVTTKANGGDYGTIAITAKIVPALEVKVSPVILDTEKWNKWAVNIKVKNNSRVNTISGKFTVTAPEELKSAGGDLTFPQLSYGEEKDLQIPVATPPKNKIISMGLKMELSDGKTQDLTKLISCLGAVKSAAPPVIDGVMNKDEWNDTMAFKLDDQKSLKKYEGPDDIDATGYLKWDDDNLYFACKVIDNKHIQTNSGAGIWQNDGLQLTIDPARIDGPGAIGWHEIGFALGNDGLPLTWRWLAIPGKEGGLVKAFDYKIIRDENAKTTCYEARMPWNSLLPTDGTMDTGDIFGFAVICNEDDGAGRGGWVGYMGGIGGHKDAKEFGDVVLIDKSGAPPKTAVPTTSPKSAAPDSKPGSNEISVTVNGKKLESDTAPIQKDERVLVPMRAIFEALGTEISWDDNSQTVTGKKGRSVITLTIDNAQAKLDGEVKVLDVPPILKDGRTLVPVRFISESLGADVKWDEVNKTVTITSK